MGTILQRVSKLVNVENPKDDTQEIHEPGPADTASIGKRRRTVIKDERDSVKATKVKNAKPAAVKPRMKKTKLDFDK